MAVKDSVLPQDPRSLALLNPALVGSTAMPLAFDSAAFLGENQVSAHQVRRCLSLSVHCLSLFVHCSFTVLSLSSHCPSSLRKPGGGSQPGTRPPTRRRAKSPTARWRWVHHCSCIIHGLSSNKMALITSACG